MTTIRDVALAQPPSAHAPDGSGRQNPNEREQPVTPLQPLHILDGHTARVYRLASIPNNNLFVSGSWDGNCRVWSAKDGEVVGKKMVHGKSVYAIVVSRDGKTMASGGSDGRIVVWDLESREKIIEWKTPSNIMALSLAMSQDSRTLASGHNNGTVMLWSASTGDHIAGPYKLHDDIVDAVAFSMDDSQIASASYYSSHIRVTYRDSHSLGEDVTPPFEAHVNGIQSLVWLPNSGQLISASRDKTIKYWDTSNDSLLIATSHGHSVYALAISSDGNLLASASWDGTTRLWNTSTHKQIGAALRHPTSLYSVALSSDGHYLAAAGEDAKVYIWNLKDTEDIAEVVGEKPKDNKATKEAAKDGGEREQEELEMKDAANGGEGERAEQEPADASDGPSLLDLSATYPQNMSRDIAQVPYYAPAGAFIADMEESPVGADKGKGKTEDVTSADEPDSHEQRHLFDAFNKEIFKSFRAVGDSFKPPSVRTQEPVPAHEKLLAALGQPADVPESSPAQSEQPPDDPVTSPNTSSIRSSGAGPSGHPSWPFLWWQSRLSSPVLQVTPVAAGRARLLFTGRQPPDQPARELPQSLQPDDPKDKWWHKYMLRKQKEHLARRQKLTATSPGSPTRDTSPLPQDPSLLPTADADTASSSQPSAQPAQTATSV